MNLTPMDIRKQKFKKAIRGYDPVEVDTFMDMVAQELEGVLRQLSEQREKLLESDTQLKDYRQIEKSLQQTLLQAQEATGKSYESARLEADAILREAESRAAKMVADAADQLSRMNNEVIDLKSKRALILARLRSLLSAELELLDAISGKSSGTDTHQSVKDVQSAG